MEIKIFIREDYIKLDSFLKHCSAVQTGGEAKIAIQEGMVLLNGEVCTQRGKKIRPGDTVTFNEESYVCDKNPV